MKKIAIIISIFLLSTTCLFAFEEKPPAEPFLISSLSSYENGATVNLQFPWANDPSVIMEKVYSKNEYSLWKCKSKKVTNFPGHKIQGNLFNYFVYKNDKFHLTVTEMNKECVFDFFTERPRKVKFPKDC